jgi:hypothetical protein
MNSMRIAGTLILHVTREALCQEIHIASGCLAKQPVACARVAIPAHNRRQALKAGKHGFSGTKEVVSLEEAMQALQHAKWPCIDYSKACKSRSELTKLDLLNRVFFAFGEDELGTFTRGQDVLT